MNNHLNNLEKTRNTKDQIDFYSALNDFIETVDHDGLTKIKAFPVYSTRQVITKFIERYEIFKLCLNTPGNILECGVGSGFGLMAFAHFCSIFEPNHYVRKIIGFDTFEGFKGISEKDGTSNAEHMKKGGLNFGSYDEILKSISFYDQNRAIGHIQKVSLVKGDITETLPKFLKDNPATVVALLYLDLDLYKPTYDTLCQLRDRIPKGGIIAFDELNHNDYPGETIAVMETLGIKNIKIQRFPFSTMLSYAILD